MKKVFEFCLVVLLIISILLGGSGCMKPLVNTTKIKSDVIEFLENKYDQKFEVIDTTLIVEPARTSYENVVCVDDIYQRPFCVYHMLDSKTVNIEDDELRTELEKYDNKIINDEYGEIVIGCKYEELLESEIDEDVFVLCEMKFNDYYATKQDIDAGINDVFNKLGNCSYPDIYVFYNKNNTDREILAKKLQSIVSKYPLNSQGVYICSVDSINKNQILSNHKENWNVYNSYLIDTDETVDRIDYFICTLEDGISEIETERE